MFGVAARNCWEIWHAAIWRCIAHWTWVLRATAHAADPWSVPGVGGYRIEEFFFFQWLFLHYIHYWYIHIGICTNYHWMHCDSFFGIHKKQQFYRPWDASPASKTIGKCPLEAQFRSTWTPAFQPKACKTQARKTLRTLPLPVANVPWRHSSKTLEHQQDSSPRHAKHKPEKLSERYLWNP